MRKGRGKVGAVPNGYPNPTRYPVFFAIPDPTRFSFGNHRVAGNPKYRVLLDISGKPEVLGITRYFGYSQTRLSITGITPQQSCVVVGGYFKKYHFLWSFPPHKVFDSDTNFPKHNDFLVRLCLNSEIWKHLFVKY